MLSEATATPSTLAVVYPAMRMGQDWVWVASILKPTVSFTAWGTRPTRGYTPTQVPERETMAEISKVARMKTCKE